MRLAWTSCLLACALAFQAPSRARGRRVRWRTTTPVARRGCSPIDEDTPEGGAFFKPAELEALEDLSISVLTLRGGGCGCAASVSRTALRLRGGYSRRAALVALGALAPPAAAHAAQQLSFVRLPNGLQFADITVGSGDEVGGESRVTVHVIGRLVGKQGWVFEDSQKDDEPYRLTMGNGEMIEGLELGLRGMRAGGSRRLIVPSTLAYQDRAHEPLPREFGNRQRLFGTVLNQNRRQQEAIGLGDGQDVAGVVLLDVKLLNVRPPVD
jgi:hypothetical protein